MAFTFEKLIVYQKAISFADNVCALTEKFPRSHQRGPFNFGCLPDILTLV